MFGMFMYRLLSGTVLSYLTTRVPVFARQILPNSAAQFVKFREIPRNPQISCIPRPVGVVVLIDNISKYKEFIVTNL